MDDLVVGLDVGTAKTVCAVGRWNEQGKPQIVALGVVASSGLRSGVVVNLGAAIKCISEAVDQAELKGYEVNQALIGLCGGGIEGVNSRGVVGVSSSIAVSPLDVERVIDAAKAVLIPMDREILHVIPQEFTVDDVKGIRDPLEMMGVRLEAEVHIITGSIAASRNLIHCVNTAGIQVKEVILESLASAYAVLSAEEKEVGVLLLDLGAGTTDALMYRRGYPVFSKVYAVGSDRITKDVAEVLKVSEDEAERLKQQFGLKGFHNPDPTDTVVIRGIGARPPEEIPKSRIAQIIHPRMEEILQLVKKDLHRHGLLDDLMGAGIVLTGGGARLIGLVDLVQEMFETPVRLGSPLGIEGLEAEGQAPEFTSAVGLVLQGLASLPKDIPSSPAGVKRPKVQAAGNLGRLFDWFKKNWM